MNQRLLIDVGNTRTKWAMSQGDLIMDVGAAEKRMATEVLISQWQRLPRPLRTYVISVGEPARLEDVRMAATSVWGGEDMIVLTTAPRAAGVTNGYRDPSRLGIDRWAALVGARRHNLAACIVDCGTAVTVDGLDRQGRHLGGAILPGRNLMISAVVGSTAKLSDAQTATEQAALFADNTGSGLQGGALFAIASLAERALSEMETEHPGVRGIITGGDAARVCELLRQDRWRYEPNLVFHGILRLAKELESDEVAVHRPIGG